MYLELQKLHQQEDGVFGFRIRIQIRLLKQKEEKK
jgi:hypothetical protein